MRASRETLKQINRMAKTALSEGVREESLRGRKRRSISANRPDTGSKALHEKRLAEQQEEEERRRQRARRKISARQHGRSYVAGKKR